MFLSWKRAPVSCCWSLTSVLASVAVGLGSSHAAIGHSVGRVGRCAMRSMCRCLSCRVVNL